MTYARWEGSFTTSLTTLAQVLAMTRDDIPGIDACESAALGDLMRDMDDEPRLPDGRIGYTVLVSL